VVVSVIVLLMGVVSGFGFSGVGPVRKFGGSSSRVVHTAVRTSGVVVEATRAPLAGAVGRWTGGLEPARDSH